MISEYVERSNFNSWTTLLSPPTAKTIPPRKLELQTTEITTTKADGYLGATGLNQTMKYQLCTLDIRSWVSCIHVWFV